MRIRQVLKHGRPKWEVDMHRRAGGRRYFDTKGEAEEFARRHFAAKAEVLPSADGRILGVSPASVQRQSGVSPASNAQLTGEAPESPDTGQAAELAAGHDTSPATAAAVEAADLVSTAAAEDYSPPVPDGAKEEPQGVPRVVLVLLALPLIVTAGEWLLEWLQHRRQADTAPAGQPDAAAPGLWRMTGTDLQAARGMALVVAVVVLGWLLWRKSAVA